MKPPVCGENATLPSRIVGCGKQIEKWQEVYRCTHCDVPFHKDCANRHFADPPLTQAHIDSMTPQEIEHACNALQVAQCGKIQL